MHNPGTPTLDQLRVFLAVVDTGSFAAAGRKLNRAVSVISYGIANLEAHHFKYDLFRRPGDIHVHFFGTATLSFAEGVTTREGDVFDIEAAPFTLPLRNPLATAAAAPVTVTQL